MDLTTVLSILGILVSLLFGAWGVYLVIKHRYPGELTFVHEQTIALFDTIVKNLPELAVLYKERPVTPNLVLIKGALVNTGKKDIAPTMIESPITIAIPKDFKWLTAKVISASEDVKSSICITEDGKLQITNGLLRCKEYVSFQALAEVPTVEGDKNEEKKKKQSFITKGLSRFLLLDSISGKPSLDKNLDKAIRFYHRIQDTRPIKMVKLKEEEYNRRRMRIILALPVLGVLTLLSVLLINYIKGTPSTFAYHIQTDSTHIVDVKIKSFRANRVRLKSLDGTLDVTLSVDDFNGRVKGKPFSIPDKEEYEQMLLVSFGYIVLPFVIFFPRYREYRFNRKLRILLSLENRK